MVQLPGCVLYGHKGGLTVNIAYNQYVGGKITFRDFIALFQFACMLYNWPIQFFPPALQWQVYGIYLIITSNIIFC